MARLGTYDYVLADIRLPDRGGYEVFRELRQAQLLNSEELGFGYRITSRSERLLVILNPFQGVILEF